MSRDRVEAADQFTRFLGECFIAHAGGLWFDYAFFGRKYSFYEEINPALRYGIDEDSDTAWRLVQTAVENGFPAVAEQLRDYPAQYKPLTGCRSPQLPELTGAQHISAELTHIQEWTLSCLTATTRFDGVPTIIRVDVSSQRELITYRHLYSGSRKLTRGSEKATCATHLW